MKILKMVPLALLGVGLMIFGSMHSGPGQAESVPLAKLTPAEREFLDQLANGYAYKEIADRMNISIDTVRSYVRTVYEKLHVHSRTEAVVKYLRG